MLLPRSMATRNPPGRSRTVAEKREHTTKAMGPSSSSQLRVPSVSWRNARDAAGTREYWGGEGVYGSGERR